ncbi:MAG: Rv1355c family protein [Nannocystaceae bacterium]
MRQAINDILGKKRLDDEQEHAWRPHLLRLDREQDRSALIDLHERGKIRSVHDEIDQQLVDLAQVRNPEIKGAALEPIAAAYVGGVPRQQYGVWVYYPWSGCLVHVLPPADFTELRTDRNRNKITREEQAKLASLTVGVVGLSVGQATALTLAMEGIGGRFRIADFDVLSLSNLNRLRAGVHEIGVPKVYITAREIYEINPFVDVTIYPAGIDRDNVDAFLTEPTPLDLVAEECDDLQVKILLRERARAHRIPVLMETSDRGMTDVERFDLEPERPLLHGLVGDIDASQLEGMTTFEKVPTVLRIIGPQTLSPRMAASMLDVSSTLASWPQLASSVALGGAVVTDTARRIALGELTVSGRYYVDLEEIINDDAPSREQPAPSYEVELPSEEPEAPPPLVASERDELDDAQVRALVAYGTLAPSGGNCQPWRFAYRAGRLHCIHDVSRSESMLDVGHIASYLAFGAVVENIEQAAASMGLATELELFPDPEQPQEVCRMGFRRSAAVAVDPALVRSMAERVTNRRLGSRVPLPEGAASALGAAADARGGRLQLVEDEAGLDALAEIIGRGERLRLLSRTMHREMMEEVRWSAEEAERTRDGLDVATLELAPTDLAGMRLISSWSLMKMVGKLGAGSGLERPSRKAIAAASAVGLVTVTGTSNEDYFRAGRAVQRVWLAATSLGLAFQPMTALLYVFARAFAAGAEGLDARELRELRDLRARFGRVFEVQQGHAEGMLFRVSVAGPPTARALRRPVDDVLVIER